jgi:hypothetical protein
MKKNTFLAAGFSFLLLLLHPILFTLKAQTITLYAGNHTAGFSGDGGQATAAEINWPRGGRIDASGNTYLVDASNHRIRKVTATGIISTFAGNGTSGYTGDGGQATAAEINTPYEVCVDNSGNVYVSDQTANVVRKIATNGIITTFAGNGTAGYSGDGGQATAAELHSPYGVNADNSGNIYIADGTNYRIRMVNTSGIITTFAGNGTSGYSGDGGQATAAEFDWPGGVAIDYAGNIYIPDAVANCIRKINTAGIISTYAGTGTAGYTGDGGQATAAKINFPKGVCIDGANNLYFGDQNNNVVRKVSASSGIITTFAGNGTAGYTGNGGPATAAELNAVNSVWTDNTNGYVYISDYNNNVFRRVTGAVPLPIQLSDFNVNCLNNDALVTWTCASQINNESFTVEKSADCIIWEPISTIKGAGNSIISTSYSTTDYAINEGTSYYRLSQSDFDGHTQTFYPVAFTGCSINETTIKAFYNNSANTIVVRINATVPNNYNIRLVNMTGQVLYSETKYLPQGYNEFTLTTHTALSNNSLYLLNVTSDRDAYATKILGFKL